MLLIDTEDTQAFILYIEQALAQLAAGHYAAFLDRFDESRLAEEDIILALKFLDSERPITKIDDPLMVPCAQCEIDLGKMNDGGYYLDFCRQKGDAESFYQICMLCSGSNSKEGAPKSGVPSLLFCGEKWTVSAYFADSRL